MLFEPTKDSICGPSQGNKLLATLHQLSVNITEREELQCHGQGVQHLARHMWAPQQVQEEPGRACEQVLQQKKYKPEWALRSSVQVPQPDMQTNANPTVKIVYAPTPDMKLCLIFAAIKINYHNKEKGEQRRNTI